MNKRIPMIFALSIIILLSGCGTKVEKEINNQEITNKVTSEEPNNLEVNSGLLIGLSKDNEINREVNPIERIPNDYRTMWIYPDNGEVTYIEKKGAIITPYKDGFYKIENKKFILAQKNEYVDNDLDSIFQKYVSYYYMSYIESHAADKPSEDLITEESFNNILENEDGYEWGFRSQAEWIWYVGNNYACIMDSDFITGGGSYQCGRDNYKIYDIASLTSIEDRKKSIALADLLDKREREKLQDYHDKYDQVLESENVLVHEEERIDTDNILLTRKNGKWQILIPLYRIYEHEGNGSNYSKVVKYIDTDIMLPKIITSYDKLCIEWDEIKSKIPNAKDAVSSPNNDLLAVMTTNKLLIFANPQNGIDNPCLSIDVNENENIILNQWATNEYVNKWSKFITNY